MDVALSWRPSLHYAAVFAVGAVFFFSVTSIVNAGFGITPPYVENNRLTRETVYEQKITLVRSDPTDDLRAQITMNVPEAESWITVDKGLDFILPAGAKQVPIIVRVTVPKDAEYKQYRGALRIRTSPVEQQAVSGVSIALGAQIDVSLEVVDKIQDFNVRKIRIADLEEGRTKWGLFFPGKIRFFMTVENTGNVPYGPTKVRFEIYDAEFEQLLETVENTNRIKRVDPFAIEEVLAELPTRLSAGRYRAKYTIFKGDEIAQQNEINVSVSTIGAVLGYVGYGLDGLSILDIVKIIVAILIPIVIVGVLIFFTIRLRSKNARLKKRIGNSH